MKRRCFFLLAPLLALACSATARQTTEDARKLARGIALTERFEGSEPSSRLLVIVAGTTDRPDDLIDEDFIPELRLQGNHDDILVSYWNLPTYASDELMNDLHEQVAASRAQRGYRQVYWIGISAGGLIALEMARRFPTAVDGLIVYAPYLGPQKFQEEIEAAGGLSSWEPKPPLEDIEKTWRWLSGYARGQERPRLVFVYGENDELAPQFDLIVPHLPPGDVFTSDGEHGWETLRELWPRVLKADPLGLLK